MNRPGAAAPGVRSVSGHTVSFAAGETIFAQGDLGTEMYIVHRGQVEIIQAAGAGERQLAVLEQGDFFGEIAILDDLPRSATARARTDCTLVEVRRPSFVQMLRANPEIAVRMMRKLTRRLRQTDVLLAGDAGASGAAALEGPAAASETAPDAGRGVLLHATTGHRFPLAAGATTIGRFDPVTGVRPDIDLTPIDGNRTSSRRHAKLARQGEACFLTEEIGVVNGTFVNGRRLATGVAAGVQAGDRLRFGRVELVFEPD